MIAKINSLIFYLGANEVSQELQEYCSDQLISLEIFSSSEKLASRLSSVDFDNDIIVVVINKDLNAGDHCIGGHFFKRLNQNRSKILISSLSRDHSMIRFDDLSNLVHLQATSFDKDCFALISSFFDGDNVDDVVLDGNLLSGLTSTQKALIRLFLSSDNREIERHAILENVWGDLDIQPKTVDVHLYNLRRKIHPYGYLIRSEGGGRWKLLSERIDQNNS